MAEHDTEPALIYYAGERRTHDQHAAEAYDFAKRADALAVMGDSEPPDFGDEDAYDEWATRIRRWRRAAVGCRDRAQWHATIAVYEALTMPADGSSVGEEAELRRDQ